MDAGVDELLGNGVRSSCSETAPLSEGVEVNCGEIDAGFSQIRRKNGRNRSNWRGRRNSLGIGIFLIITFSFHVI
jgi:hypothetical protein